MPTDDPKAREIVDLSQVLVVIPALNEAKHIEHTILTLLDDEPGLISTEIIIADGGSTDQTRQIVGKLSKTHPNVSLLDNPDRLQAAGVNHAVEQRAEEHHRYLVRVDAHSHYPANYVKNVAQSLIDKRADAVAVVMDTVAHNCFQRGLDAALDTPLGTGGSAHRGGTRSGFVDHGHHAGMRLDRFRQLGGYCPDFATNEDAEFDHRLTKAGGRIWLDAQIRIGYVVRDTPAGLAQQYWRYGKGRAQTLLKHRMRPKLRQLAPLIATGANLICLILAPLVPKLLLIPALYLLLMLGTGLGLAIVKKSACALWAGPAFIIMHMAWGGGFMFQVLKQKSRVG